MTSSEHGAAPVDMYLDPEIVSFFPAETQADLEAGSLALDESDFLLAAGLTNPADPRNGIRDGESLVVAQFQGSDGFVPELLITSAQVDRRWPLLRDREQPDGRSFLLHLSSDRPNILRSSTGRKLQVEDRLYIPGPAYGVWLRHMVGMTAVRGEYRSLIPQHDMFRVHVARRPAAN